jgi:hypothetical protein
MYIHFRKFIYLTPAHSKGCPRIVEAPILSAAFLRVQGCIPYCHTWILIGCGIENGTFDATTTTATPLSTHQYASRTNGIVKKPITTRHMAREMIKSESTFTFGSILATEGEQFSLIN